LTRSIIRKAAGKQEILFHQSASNDTVCPAIQQVIQIREGNENYPINQGKSQNLFKFHVFKNNPNTKKVFV